MDNGIELNPYISTLRQDWDQVVKDSKNGNFLHLRNYMDYHAHRFDERSVVITKQGRPIAVFPCNRVTDQVISHGGLTYGGLIYGVDVRAADVLEVFRQLVRYYKQTGIKSLLYKAIPHIFHSYPAEEDIYALFRLNAKLYRRDISTVIQMDKRIKISELRRRNVKKSVKNGVEIQEGIFFEDYHQLLTQVISKFGTQPVHSAAELQLLQSRFPDSIRLFGAFKDGRLLAGTLIYDFAHVAHAQYLASSDEGREVGALDFVLAHLIENVFSSKQYFSLGISTEDNGQYLNDGLLFQKEGFGGRGIAHDFYELDIFNLE